MPSIPKKNTGELKKEKKKTSASHIQRNQS